MCVCAKKTVLSVTLSLRCLRENSSGVWWCCRWLEFAIYEAGGEIPHERNRKIVVKKVLWHNGNLKSDDWERNRKIVVKRVLWPMEIRKVIGLRGGLITIYWWLSLLFILAHIQMIHFVDDYANNECILRLGANRNAKWIGWLVDCGN